MTTMDFWRVVQSWDTANKPTPAVGLQRMYDLGRGGPEGLFAHVLRRRMDYPDLKCTVVEHAQAFNATTVLIEDKASGPQLIQELARGALAQVKGVKPKGDKIMRMQAQTPHVENEFVLLPERAPWVDAYILEMTTFQQNRYDDQVDSMSQALEWISVGKRTDGGVD